MACSKTDAVTVQDIRTLFNSKYGMFLVPMLTASGTYAVLLACVCMYVCVCVSVLRQLVYTISQ